MLRSKAQLLADSMRNLIAVQTFAWGSGNKAPIASSAYEVRVVDGYQLFRKYHDGEKELEQMPWPHLTGWVLPSNEWSNLPKMVGTEFQLKIRQAPRVALKETRINVFQYYASAEDNLCPLNSLKNLASLQSARASPSHGSKRFGLTRTRTKSECRSIWSFLPN
jgi:hypothetical protein